MKKEQFMLNIITDPFILKLLKIPPTKEISESSSNRSYRNTDEV